MKLKLIVLVIPFILNMQSQMQANQDMWPKLVDNVFAVTNSVSSLLILQQLRDPLQNNSDYASKAFLGYVLPCFILNKYKENINRTPDSRTAEKLQVGISSVWCAYTMYKVLNPSSGSRAVIGQPALRATGYPRNPNDQY